MSNTYVMQHLLYFGYLFILVSNILKMSMCYKNVMIFSPYLQYSVFGVRLCHIDIGK